MALAAEEPRAWLHAAGLSSWHGFGMCLWDSPGCTTELASMGSLAGRRGLLGDCRRCRSVTAEVKADFVSLVEI